MRMWAPLGRNSNSSHEAANCGYARTTTTTYFYVRTGSSKEFGNKCLPSYFSTLKLLCGLNGAPN